MSKYPTLQLHDHDPLQDYYYDGIDGWYSVARLIDIAKDLPRFDMPLAGMNLSDRIWAQCDIYDLAAHCKRVRDADLSKPILLAWDGSIADGRHRIIKALITGQTTIKAVRLTYQPTPCRKEDK